MAIHKLEKMTNSYKTKHGCGLSLFIDLKKLNYTACSSTFSFNDGFKNRTIQFCNDLEKIIIGYIKVKGKVNILALDGNGDFYLANKLKNIEPISLMKLLEQTHYNSVALKWYQSIFQDQHSYDFSNNILNETECVKKGFSRSSIKGSNCSVSGFFKPILRRYSIIVYECLVGDDSISYILEDKKKNLVFFFKTSEDLAECELAKIHSISTEFIERVPNITPYYALA